MRLVWTICLPLVLLYLLAGRYLVYIFLDSPSGEAMETGVLFLRIVAPFYFVVASKLVADSVMRGSGDMKRFMIATFTDLVLRVVFAMILSRTALGSAGIWAAWPIGWTVATVISMLFYRQIKRKQSLLVSGNATDTSAT